MTDDQTDDRTIGESNGAFSVFDGVFQRKYTDVAKAVQARRANKTDAAGKVVAVGTRERLQASLIDLQRAKIDHERRRATFWRRMFLSACCGFIAGSVAWRIWVWL